MKKFKKLSRRNLEQINGAAADPNSYCKGCPDPNAAISCEEYWALPANCRNCVLINSECYVSVPGDL
ncbi:bacteriocin-like protein [Chryseobacterium daeguense]|uniref:bacteriocin-like protein n=1 Tax=Chryseobacterium daeguense TaxID=412438 RepID=UPI000417369E|nr:hypothetical protein [Chryseobacterium daeguense]